MTLLISDRELKTMRSDLESDRVERKRSAGDRNGIRRSICAFANDLPGHGRPGVILIGVEDDGSCSENPVGEPLLRQLAGMRDDGNILPLPSMIVQKKILGGCEAAAVIVQPSEDTPVRYRGRVWVRVGPTTRQATPEEEHRLAERRRAGDLPFDLRPCSEGSIDDLDIGYIEEQYLPRAVAQDVLDEDRRPLKQQLRSLRLLVGEMPTWGALLGFGRHPLRWIPGAYVLFLRIDGERITDTILDHHRLTGRLEDVLRRLDDLLKINIRTSVDLTTGARDIRLPDYPVNALRQLAFNAVMHRTYDGTNAPVRIYWYIDRIEMDSPGGLYGQVTLNNFGKGATDYRNPLLAEIMYHLGFAQPFGLGIPEVHENLKENGNPPPAFSLGPTHVTATVRPAA